MAPTILPPLSALAPCSYHWMCISWAQLRWELHLLRPYNQNHETFIVVVISFRAQIFQDLALGTVLMRPVRLFIEEDMSNELMLSKKYASVKRVFIISEEDKLGKRDFQLWMIEKNPPDAVKEIKGSDHMVMISKPKELWVHLQAIAEKYSWCCHTIMWKMKQLNEQEKKKSFNRNWYFEPWIDSKKFLLIEHHSSDVSNN